MKQAGHTKRPHGRSPERYRHHPKQQNSDSGENKMRGNPQQCVEKYLSLARDAASSGDPISAENYYQYADHYYRLSLASRLSRAPSPEPRNKAIKTHTPPPEVAIDVPPVVNT